MDLNALAAATSASGLAAAAAKVMRYVPVSLGDKWATGIVEVIAVQATTVLIKNFISDLMIPIQEKNYNFILKLNSDEENQQNNLFSNYPFNLLPEMNLLIDANLIFLSIIFNSFLVKKFINYNYSQYLPNNKFGRLLTMLIDRYIKIWSHTSNFLIYYCWIMIFLSTLVLKLSFYVILNN